ncbi:MAG: hypothetical protein ABEJ72_09615, partial [Candidatus Aenigmatarchaeota archaeon]
VTHEMDIDKLNVDAEEALDTAKKTLEEDYSPGYGKLLLSLKKVDGKQEWNVTFIKKGGSLVSVEVDTVSGELIDSEENSLMDTGKAFGG